MTVFVLYLAGLAASALALSIGSKTITVIDQGPPKSLPMEDRGKCAKIIEWNIA